MRGSWNGTRQEVSTGAGSEPVATDRSSPGEWQDDSAGMQAEILEQTYFRWRKEYRGLHVDQAKRLKELEQENAKLKQTHRWAAVNSPDDELLPRCFGQRSMRLSSLPWLSLCEQFNQRLFARHALQSIEETQLTIATVALKPV